METLMAKVYGKEGHRQAVSFYKSSSYDWSNDYYGIRRLQLICSDVTGTNDYVIVTITRNTKAECKKELRGQLSDGIFENSKYGKVESIFVEG